MKGVLTLILVLIIILIVIMSMKKTNFVNYVAPYAPKSQKNWWKRAGWERFGFPYYSYWSEGYENLNDRPAEVSAESEQQASLLTRSLGDEGPVMEFPPDTPGPADLYNNQPYHLLADEMSPPRVKETISCVNSRSCYATDFERMVSKTGNYRQFTNNYKRNYPDSCSAPTQELVLNFYKADPMPIPQNNTGGSVSEVGFGLN
jgi:hypothetical protein|uniref:Uncharacterized protein n=1 Tax=viral metagenome TaxID=1070528 RepID=A0A6C0DYV0_9ZZZZ